jgi:predicted dehydrogenase
MADTLGVAVLGTGWMARAHTHALRALADLDLPGPAIRLRTVISRDLDRAGTAANRLGYETSTDDWRRALDDPQVHILLNVAANELHPEPSIAALETGRHVLCEKPLASHLGAATRMAEVAASNGESVAACAYNYRFVPAVQLVRDLISEGRLGSIRHVRFSYLQDWAGTMEARTGWRFAAAGEGSSVADYSHIIDLLCWLIGEPVSVCSAISTLAQATGLRPATTGRDHEDWYAALVRLESGVTATLEASRVATGAKGRQSFEIYGSRGAVSWDMEDMNRLRYYDQRDTADPRSAGARDILVTEPTHPYLRHWWAPGHVLGWEHTLVHQWIALLDRVNGRGGESVATFADGLRASQVVEAIQRSSSTAAWTEVEPADQPPTG